MVFFHRSVFLFRLVGTFARSQAAQLPSGTWSSAAQLGEERERDVTVMKQDRDEDDRPAPLFFLCFTVFGPEDEADKKESTSFKSV